MANADRLVDRIGAAVVAPRAAMAAAARLPGRTPGDAALLLALMFIVARTPELAAAVWTMLGGDVSSGLQTLLARLASAVTPPLLFLFAAGAVVTLLAGRRRSLGNDFDLACVAIVPVVFGPIAVQLVLTVTRMPGGPVAMRAASVVSYGWAAALIVFAVLEARRRPPRSEQPT